LAVYRRRSAVFFVVLLGNFQQLATIETEHRWQDPVFHKELEEAYLLETWAYSGGK